MYGIRSDYKHRTTPAYFVDNMPDGKQWQPEVLPIAAHLARGAGAKTLVDIGCGRGHKLAPYAHEFNIVGIDYGANIDYCRQTHEFGTWLEHDLEKGVPDFLHEGFTPEVAKNSVFICSDVIEHLINPEPLVVGLAAYAVMSPVILSTPDRERVYSYDHLGEPMNPHHVREWTLLELGKWLCDFSFSFAWAGWTLNNDVDRQHNTCFMVLCSKWHKRDLATLNGVFDVRERRPEHA